MRPDPERFAALLAGYCLDVQPGQQVLVRSTTQAAPLLLALQRELLGRGAWPLLRTALPGQDETWWAAAQDHHLDAFAPAGDHGLCRGAGMVAVDDVGETPQAQPFIRDIGRRRGDGAKRRQVRGVVDPVAKRDQFGRRRRERGLVDRDQRIERPVEKRADGVRPAERDDAREGER